LLPVVLESLEKKARFRIRARQELCYVRVTREVDVIENRASTSSPRNPRPPARRQSGSRQKAVSHYEISRASRWKVQLELAPAEIALVYRQGLAHGAEVRRSGTQEWRPLVTTPELRAALSIRESRPDWQPVSRKVPSQRPPAASVTGEPSLAALLLAQRPPALPTVAPPPPPPVVTITHVRQTALTEPTVEIRDSYPDSAVTQLRTLGLPSAEFESPVVTSVPPPAAHARPAELSFVATAAMVATLLLMLLLQRASHWGEVRALIPENRVSGAAPAAERTVPGELVPALVASPSVAHSRSIPVVPVRDLPMEQGAWRGSSLGSKAPSAAGAGGGPDRAELARIFSRAAAAAQGCGEGPVQAQIVATFAPSGVARSIHFGAAAPPADMRACVLNAFARTRVTPFVGAPITVSKNLSW
jgi:hypothetical protein